MSMKVAVTGGAGFIGSHIAEELLEAGYEVVVLDNLSGGKRDNVPPGATLAEVDITGQELEDWFAAHRPDYVIHHAAQINVTTSIEDPAHDASTNITGTLRLLQCCVKYQVRKVVYASSAAIYGNPESLPVDESHPIRPLSPYGLSKYTPEQYLRIFSELSGLNYTVLRYANVYGPRQAPHGDGGVVAIFTRKAAAGEPFPIQGDGKQTRDFIYVRDVAKANRLALHTGDRQAFNISWGKPISISGLIQAISRVTGRPAETLTMPPRAGDIKDSYLSNERARAGLGWQPVFSLEDGLRLTLEHLSHS